VHGHLVIHPSGIRCVGGCVVPTFVSQTRELANNYVANVTAFVSDGAISRYAAMRGVTTFMSHTSVVSDKQAVISDKPPVTFRQTTCHTHHPKGRVGGAGVTRLSLPNVPSCASERWFLVGRSPAPIANQFRTSTATPRTGDREARDSDTSRAWAAQRVVAATGSRDLSRMLFCTASVMTRWQTDLLLEGHGHVLIVFKSCPRGDD
jgi:hypothetical protein